jgi:hypothetical protein
MVSGNAEGERQVEEQEAVSAPAPPTTVDLAP